MAEENELIRTVTHVLQEMTDEDICRLLQKYFNAIGKDPMSIGCMEELNTNFGDSKTYVIKNLSDNFNTKHSFYFITPDKMFHSFNSINDTPAIGCVIPEMEDYMVEHRNSLGNLKLEKIFASERQLDHKKMKTFEVLQAMDDEELCRIFNHVFSRLRVRHVIGHMNNIDAALNGYKMRDIFLMLDDDFNPHDNFYSFKPGVSRISSFNNIKESDFYYEKISLVVDYMVENNCQVNNSNF